MSKWKAGMPKDRPADGVTQIVFAAMNSKGARVEFAGQVTEECARKMLALAIENPVKLELTPGNDNLTPFNPLNAASNRQ